MADLGELAAKLKILSDAYAAQLPEKFTKLEQIWNQLPQNEWREEGFEMLHRSVHSLTGSGKTFGFTALSDVARKFEDYLNRIGQTRIPPNGEQRNHIASLIAELRQVAINRDQHPADHSELIAVKPGRIAHDTVRRIFIVEDDIALAENLKNQLSYFGYDVSAYNSLSEFKQAIQENDDIVVVMDISFPEDSWGGVHVMKEVQKNRTSPLPVVFLSSHDDLEARLEAVRAGGIAYFNKSLNLSNLIDKLDELTSTQQAAPYRVLIIDDSPSLTAFYAAVLEEVGMVTRSINDPLDVMQPLLEFEPDLILIDMYMPGCNGMELARVIRQLEAFISIPIVFLSGEKDIDKQLVAMNLGGDDFLTKPIHPQHLVASVSSRIRRSLMLRSFMVRDSLTGLLNHTAIKDQLDREVARSKRAGVRCCFAMVDIDFFKKVNDTYGHPVGDRVIKSLSRLLKQRLRESDAVGRYGGEEFAVILADADSATARKVLDTIREDFSRLRHMSDGVEFSVTFSCGIADVADFPDAKKMADAADRALYTAKHAGRNQVSIASAEMSAI
jgi:diguanylate cyclase (GGDEF)-like protein